MSIFTITATCGGESATTLVQVPPDPGDALLLAVDTINDPVARITVVAPPGVTQVDVEFGDGGTATLPVVGGIAWIDRTYLDNGTFTVTATTPTPGVTPGTAQVVITGAYVRPSLTLTADTSDDPDVTFTVTITRPDQVTEVTLSTGVPDDPPVIVPTGGQATVTIDRTIPIDGTFTATVTATDAQPGSIEYTISSAANVLQLSVTVVDDPNVRAIVSGIPQQATEVVIDWGDGTPAQTVTLVGSHAQADHTYATNSTFTITATAVDSVPAEQAVTITEAVGALTVAVDTSADPIVTVTVTSPPGVPSVTIAFGDGTTETVPVTAGTASASHEYGANGTFTVTATAPGVTTGTAQAVITGAAMIIVLRAAPDPQERLPGRHVISLTFPARSLSPTEIYRNDTLLATVPAGSTSYSTPRRVSNNGIYVVRASNPDWPVEPESVEFEITDMMTATIDSQSGMTVTVTGHTDAGIDANAVDVSFSWGDGVTDRVPYTDIHSVTASHTYATPGTRTVLVGAAGSGQGRVTVTTPAPAVRK